MFMLPEGNNAKLGYQDAEETFGNSGGIAIAITSPEGIYQTDLLTRVRALSSACRELNIRIPAGQLAAQLGLPPDKSLALAGLLQNLSGDPDFTAAMLARTMAAPDDLAEALTDALPVFIEIEDRHTFSRELADNLTAMAASNPKLAGELFTFARQTTDMRGRFHSVWIEQVVSVTETNTVWPEFTDHTGIVSALAPFDLTGPDLARFADILLEAGATRADLIMAYPASELKSAGVSKAFRDSLARHLTREAALVLEQAMSDAPKQIRVADLVSREITADSMEGVRTRLNGWPFFEKSLYSKDEKSLLVVVRSTPNLDQPNRERVLEAIKAEVAQMFSDGRYIINMAGYAVVDEAVAQGMIQDVARLFPMVIAVVVLFLFFSFRNVPGVFYPLLTVLIAVAWCIGVMSGLKVPLSVVGTAMPVLLVAVGSAYGIHLVHYFSQHHGGRSDRRRAVAETLDGTGRGVVMAGLTTVAGFASLAFNDIVPLRDFGLFTALGVLFALLVSLVLIPALLARFGVRAPSRQSGGFVQFFDRLSSRLIVAISRYACRKPARVTMVTGVVLLGAVVCFSGLRVEMNNIAFFKRDSDIRQADAFINQAFAGTVNIRVVFRASEDYGVIDPQVLDTMQHIARTVQKRHPEIGKTLSVIDLICKMNQAFYFNDPSYYRLPAASDLAGDRTEEALKSHVASYIDKFQRSDARSFIDAAKRETVLILQVNTASSSVSRKIVRSLQDMLESPLGDTLRQKGVQVQITGIGALYLESERLIVNGQLRSIAVSVVIVLLMVAFIMRSVTYGLLAVLPLCVSIGINFGVMGLLDIPLDAATAISACVAIGIGIDYGVHYLNRYRIVRAAGKEHQEAALLTAATTGGAICINAFAVTAGFSVLLFSAFVPLIHLGFLIALTMLTSSAGALILLPAVLTLAQRFEPTSSIHKE
ncbi:MAG: hypothetical protein VR64_01010 [Desulfatitalea sp. BRH_c12]|nr:MAG: hypothetical protein VR64_01010 [Desulfatitalea sp. BRH_c12]